MIMALFDFFDFSQLQLYEVYCPFCGKWAFDTDLEKGRIIQPCRVCGRRLVLLNKGDGPLLFKDRRKKARLKVRVNPS